MRWIAILSIIFLTAACELDATAPSGSISSGDVIEVAEIPFGAEQAQVTRVIDGDTIDVAINGQTFRVRYVGVNTPERDEPCYQEAVSANRALVENQTVWLVKDTSDTDRYDRLLRYIYVGNVFVNATLVYQGYAEVVRYDPDDEYFTYFRDLEDAADAADRGCHQTTIFDDGSYTR
ncbi:MAG: hypothetical protein CUN56_07585 [Phototrophicales bacterium]|nr:MAG: hypothetical protein CUN56_07585 [Phototrophicales bacterium]RMG70351.1 MAG: hypothetical protein D6711_17510 [Chloroflexota bacterium]